MRVTVTANTDDLRKRMAEYARIVKKDVNQELRRHARLACVELARYTQPFRAGDKDQGRALGEKAVEVDINKVFYTTAADGFYNAISEIAQESYNSRSRWQKGFNAQEAQAKFQKRLRGYIDSNNRTALRRIAKSFNWQGVISRIDPQLHQGARSGPRRKVRKTRGTMYFLLAGQGALNTYINKVKKRVGMAKSGWATCAEKIPQLGQKQAATTGIPNWVTRNKNTKYARGSTVDASSTFRNSNNPRVIMRNAVPWTSQNLSASANRFALRFAKDKFVKMMNIQIRYVLRKQAKLR